MIHCTHCRVYLVIRTVSLVLAATVIFSARVDAQTPSKKHAPPTVAEQKQSYTRLNAKHGKRIESIKKGKSSARDFAETLLVASGQSGLAPSDRYVWLMEASKHAVRAGDAQLAMDAIREMEEQFEFEPFRVRRLMLNGVLAKAKNATSFRQIFDAAMREGRDAVERNRFSHAVAFAKIAKQASEKINEKALSAQVLRLEQRGSRMADVYKSVQPFAERLKTKPVDEEANERYGLYLCHWRENWEQGLFYLAQGKTRSLRLQAQRDLLSPDDAKAQKKLGDTWWKIADDLKDLPQLAVRRRAVWWYRQALHGLDGAEQTRLQKLIATVPSGGGGRVPWDHSGPSRFLRLFAGQNGPVYCAVFSPDGHKVVTADSTGRVRFFDAKGGKQLLMFRAHLSGVWDMKFDATGRRLFTSGIEGCVKMWDAATGKQLKQYPPGGLQLHKYGIAITKDGKRILIGQARGEVELWDVDKEKLIRRFSGHRNIVSGVAFSPDERFIMTMGYNDRQVIYWNVRTGKKIRTFPAGISGRTVAISPDGRSFVTTGDQVVRIRNIQSGRELKRLTGHNTSVYSAVFSHDGKRLVTADGVGNLRYWDVRTGKSLQSFQVGGAIYDIALSPGGGRVIAGSSISQAKMYGLPRR